jgi:hypothetical protein
MGSTTTEGSTPKTPASYTMTTPVNAYFDAEKPLPCRLYRTRNIDFHHCSRHRGNTILLTLKIGCTPLTTGTSIIVVINTPSKKVEQRKASLFIANRQFKVSAVANKIDHDIQFLREKLERIQDSTDPNEVIRQTYESMLKSRENVRQWLQAYHSEEEEAEQAAPMNTDIKAL